MVVANEIKGSNQQHIDFGLHVVVPIIIVCHSLHALYIALMYIHIHVCSLSLKSLKCPLEYCYCS